MTGDSGLLLCPFCGGRADLLVNDDHPLVAVMCTNKDCGALGPREFTEDDAVQSWNCRAEDEIPELGPQFFATATLTRPGENLIIEELLPPKEDEEKG